MDAREAALDLTDYVLGSLPEPRRADVAAALAADPDLQALEAWLRQVQRLLRLAGGAIFGHPGGDALVAFAMNPEIADHETAAHAAACPTCREVVSATRDLHRDLGGWRGLRGRMESAWSRRRSVLVLGAAAGVCAVALAVVMLLPRHHAPAGATRTVTIERTVRGAPVTTPTVVIGGADSVTLLLAINPYVGGADVGVSADLSLQRDGDVAYRWTGAADAVWNSDLGVMSIVVPARRLAPGEYELVLRLDGDTVLQRTLAVTL